MKGEIVLNDIYDKEELTIEQRENLNILIEKILNPLQYEWIKLKQHPFKIITVTGGGKKYHKSSPHLTGEAVDISTDSIYLNRKLFKLAQELNLPYNYIISENNYRNIHIAIGLRSKQKPIKIHYQTLKVIK